AIVQSIAEVSFFTPDHAAVVGTRISVETDLSIGANNRSHIERASRGIMRGLLKVAGLVHLDIAEVGEMDSLGSAKLFDHGDDVVADIRAQRAGAERQAVRRCIDRV